MLSYVHGRFVRTIRYLQVCYRDLRKKHHDGFRGSTSIIHAYGFLWIPKDSYGIPMDAYGFLWISMDSYGIPMDS
jgi:hypothetical protein